MFKGKKALEKCMGDGPGVMGFDLFVGAMLSAVSVSKALKELLPCLKLRT